MDSGIVFEEAPPADKRHVEDRRAGERRALAPPRADRDENGRPAKNGSGDWLDSLTSAERKLCPVAEGVIDYWPDALVLLAYHSKMGNDKHNPCEPLRWAREKSADHRSCVARHLIGNEGRDESDGTLHAAGLAWRAMCNLQLLIEKLHERGESPFAIPTKRRGSPGRG